MVRTSGALPLLVLLVAACSLPMMPVKPDLVPQQPFSRAFLSRGDVRFGAFHATGFTSDSASGTERDDNAHPVFLRHQDTTTAYDDFSFKLEEDGGPPRMVSCSAVKRSERAHEGRISVVATDESLRCALWLSAGSPEYAELRYGSEGAGTLRSGARTLAIQARNLGGNADTLSVAGYGISDGGRDVAVVQSVNSGGVWITRDAGADERALLAAAAAALLVYQPLAR